MNKTEYQRQKRLKRIRHAVVVLTMLSAGAFMLQKEYREEQRGRILIETRLSPEGEIDSEAMKTPRGTAAQAPMEPNGQENTVSSVESPAVAPPAAEGTEKKSGSGGFPYAEHSGREAETEPPPTETPQKRKFSSAEKNTQDSADAEKSGSIGAEKEAGISRKININTASREELIRLPGVGEKTAELILQYREENGGFASIEEIQNVKRIGMKTYEKLKGCICVS